ncbi:MAG: BatA and WFA domain-containing protein [Bacteroidales bacterium]|nr:BatA and WFA domain-containing protein [Bacteroidales bacterium]
MAFLQPAFLWGIMGIIIPIVIHFLELRRFRKQYFSDNYFLIDLLKKKRRQQKIKQWLVLLSRILFIVFLSLAFAQPVRTDEKSMFQFSRAILYIDNSFSMQTFDQKMSLFERAKQFALRMIDQLPPQTLWLILTNDETYPLWLLPDEAKNKIKSIQVAPFSFSYELLVKKVQDYLAQHEQEHIYFFLLTDFQRSQGKLDALKNFQGKIFLIPFWGFQRKNICVDTTWLENLTASNEGGKFVLMARIKNFSEENIEQLPVSVFLNQTLVSTSMMQIPARGQADIKFDINSTHREVYNGYVEIDDPMVPFDNRSYFGFRSRPPISIMHIAGKGRTQVIPAIFADEKIFQFRSYLPSQLDYEWMRTTKLIILEEIDFISENFLNKIRDFLVNGGVVAIIPPQKKELKKTYEQLFNHLRIPMWTYLDTNVTKVTDLQYQHFLFRGVFIAPPDKQSIIHVKKHYVFPVNSGIPIISMANQHSFLIDFPMGKGHVFVLSVPLSEGYSSLPSNALVVPLFIQMAFKTEAIPTIAYSLEDQNGIPLNVPYVQQEQPPYLKMNEQIYYLSFSRGNPLQIFLNRSVQNPGFAEVWYGNSMVSAFGLNYSRRESNPETYSLHELDSLFRNLSHVRLIREGEKISVERMNEIIAPSISWWKWSLLASLFFLLLEIFMLRLWK